MSFCRFLAKNAGFLLKMQDGWVPVMHYYFNVFYFQETFIMSEDSLSETSMEDLDRAELTAKSLASVCMNRVTQGLYGIESDKQIDALHMYDWLPEEWSKNYNIMHQWKLLMYDTKIRILTRILHILGTTQKYVCK